MKLNPDLIRDILLTVEEKCDFDNGMEYLVNQNHFDLLKKYPHDEITYHIRQCDDNELICGVHYYENGQNIIIRDLTPRGHEFISNIRDSGNWYRIKNHAKSIGSFSLNTLQQIAINVISSAISNTKF